MNLRLNTLSNAFRKLKKRVGRGIGSGSGKTCGRGHKGQKARSGGFHMIGFEGGQTPLYRRLPKSGFRSRKALVREEIRLGDLDKINAVTITVDTLKACGLVRFNTKYVKVIMGGEIKRAITLKGIRASANAKQAILAVDGKVEES